MEGGDKLAVRAEAQHLHRRKKLPTQSAWLLRDVAYSLVTAVQHCGSSLARGRQSDSCINISILGQCPPWTILSLPSDT